MAGPSDISTILSQAGRIEKVNQSPFAQSEVSRQILTEEEARERLRRNREVNASKKGQAIQTEDRRSGSGTARGRPGAAKAKEASDATNTPETEEKHLIDLVI